MVVTTMLPRDAFALHSAVLRSKGQGRRDECQSERGGSTKGTRPPPSGPLLLLVPQRGRPHLCE